MYGNIAGEGWLEDYMVNREGQNTGRNYIIDFLEER